MKTLIVFFALLSFNAHSDNLSRRISCEDAVSGALVIKLTVVSKTEAIDADNQARVRLSPLDDNGQHFDAMTIGSGSYEVFNAIPSTFIDAVLAATTTQEWRGIKPANGEVLYQDLDGPNGQVLESRDSMICRVEF